MNKLLIKIKKLLAIFLIASLLFGRSAAYLPAIYAQGSPPAIPTVPAVPTIPASPSDAPAAPTVPAVPTVPVIPTIPSSSSPTSGVSQPTDAPAAPTDPPAAQTESQTSVTPTGEVTSSIDASPTPTGEGVSTYSQGDGSVSGSMDDPANIATGPLSTNVATEKNENWQEVLNKNLADLENKISAASSTGFNYANMNTLDGQVFTGDAQTTVNLLNKLNSNISGLGSFQVYNVYGTQFSDIVFKFADNSASNSFNSASGTVSKNAVTGPLSDNYTDAASGFTVKEANGNDATITNDIDIAAITGENSASYNTGSGTVKTGNATALGNIINLANTNLNVGQWLIGVVNVFGTLAGNIVLPKDDNTQTVVASSTGGVLSENATTGPGSTNTTEVTNSDVASFENTNIADITTNVSVSANAGNNDSSYNTGGGSVTTGSADASVANSTIANTNINNEDGTVWMIIVNEAGKWVGHIIGAPWGQTSSSNGMPIQSTTGGVLAENSGTGPISTNSSSYSSSSDSVLSNTNTAGITNNINAAADTGNNDAKYNTGSGNIETGDAKVGVNLVNMVNTNVVAKKFVAVLVNVLGTFLGDVIPPDEQANYQPSANIFALNENTQLPEDSQNPSSTVDTLPSSVGGTDSVVQQATVDGYQVSYTDTLYVVDTGVENNQNIAVQVNTIRNNQPSRRIVNGKRYSYAYPSPYPVVTQASTTKRGIFFSPAFAKATETSFAGMLLGGARFKVSESWLSIIPFAFVFMLLRRRRIDVTKYLNSLLEIVL